jgi:hypothetical protein
MNLIPYVSAWGVMAVLVAILAMYRKSLTSHEDDTIHLNAGADDQLAGQQTMVRKLKAIDRWGIGLTIVTAVTGLALLGYFLYQSWMSSYKLPE